MYLQKIKKILSELYLKSKKVNNNFLNPMYISLRGQIKLSLKLSRGWKMLPLLWILTVIKVLFKKVKISSL